MLAWVGHVKVMSHQLDDIRVNISDEDTVLTLIMGLNKSYDLIIISFNTTPAEQLTLKYVISCILNKEVCCDNIQAHGLVMKAKEENKVRVKKEKRKCCTGSNS